MTNHLRIILNLFKFFINEFTLFKVNNVEWNTSVTSFKITIKYKVLNATIFVLIFLKFAMTGHARDIN